jgi:hypothetical protein
MKKEGVSERSLLVVAIALGIADAWINRYSVNGDGVSYLDVGDSYFRGDWAVAINGYWSPLYSWCLGLAMYLFKPSLWWELVTAHLVNLLIYVGVLFSFRFFCIPCCAQCGKRRLRMTQFPCRSGLCWEWDTVFSYGLRWC